MSDSSGSFLFLGPEDGLKSDEIEGLRKRVAKRTGEKPDEHRFYLPSDPVAGAMDILRNGSLFSAHRLVILNGVEQLKKKADVAPLLDYLESPNPDATLILVSESIKVDARIQKAVPGANRKVFWEMFENQKHGWVSSYFSKSHVEVTEDAIELFLEIVENNTAELRSEADKLCTFVGPNGSVDVEDVETFVYHSREESVFTLFRHLTGDSFEAALSAVDKLHSSGSGAPVQLIGGLAFQFRRLLALRVMIDNDLQSETAFNRLNIRGKRIQAEYRTAAKKYQTDDLERAIHLLTEYDALFRSMRPGIHRCLLDMLIYQLMFSSERLVRSPGLAGDESPISGDPEDYVLVR